MTYVDRTLWFEDLQGHKAIGEGELLRRPESLVVLGEPGMGKSELLKKLSIEAGVNRVTARQFINRPDPRSLVANGSPIIIDALDEVPARGTGDAVDLVLQQLGQLGYPRFILSCRVADWRSATSVAAIREQYDEAPLEVHLEPFTREQQIEILAGKVGFERAKTLMDHFEAFGLEILGNPQTIELVGRLPEGQKLPESSGALFDFAVEALRKEHREGAGELPGPEARDAAGAAFAGLILAGKSRISRKASANIIEDEVTLVDLDSLCDEHLEVAIRTRLFAGAGDGDLTYWHRRVGEFLGAAWLSKRANTRSKRKRLLELFRSRGLVPANLRGLHAWLARDPNLAIEVIATDPMGVIEYGDADELNDKQAKELFDALERLAERNPWFKGWNDVRAQALVAPSLQNRAERLLSDRAAPYHLRVLIADQLNNASAAERFRATLRTLLLDPHEDFYIRRRAASAASHLVGEDWDATLRGILEHSSRNSGRLAFELIELVGVETFSDQQVVEALLAHDGLLFSAVPREPASSTLLSFWRFEKRVPDERLEGLLDKLTEYTAELLPKNAGIDENQLIDLAYSLILRRLEADPLDPIRVWNWLKPYEEQHSYRRDNEKTLGVWFAENDEVRRAIQRHVIFDESEGTVWRKAMRLTRRSAGLMPNDEDVVALLERLDPNDRSIEVWREVLQLVHHDGDKGKTARKAALPFVSHNPQMVKWLDRLAEPKTPEWKIKQDRRQEQRRRKQAAKFEEHRRDYLRNVEKVREGQFGFVHAPAQAYLKMFRDVGDDLQPHERIAQWLGEEVAAAAHEGFEQFLTRKPYTVTAPKIAVGFAKGTRWYASDIIIAALAERIRTHAEPFAALSEERLMAGLFTLWHTRIDDHAGIPEMEGRLEEEIKSRGAWERAIRIYITPQLKRRKEHVDRLYQLMRAHDQTGIVTKLAAEWLQECSDLPAVPEAEMIDRLLISGRYEELRGLVSKRLELDLDDERRRNWDAVQVIVDFDAARARIGNPVEKELLWHLRSRAGDRRSDDHASAAILPSQRAWIVSRFRGVWPNRERPSGTSSGDENYWDASDYLKSQISRLGDDTSSEAVAAVAVLSGAEKDGYTDYVRVVAAEQQQKLAEQTYDCPSLVDLKTILDAGPPIDSADLRAVLVDGLETVQAWLCGSDIDWYRGFFRDDGRHKGEEHCRDELIKMLRAVEPGLVYEPETHLADDKRVDIIARVVADIILPIEVKGQWHADLWTAADKQLGHLYCNDWRADHGIYLVLWFGPDVSLTKPPEGVQTLRSPKELQAALTATSKEAQAGRVTVVVLDLTRPNPC